MFNPREIHIVDDFINFIWNEHILAEEGCVASKRVVKEVLLEIDHHFGRIRGTDCEDCNYMRCEIVMDALTIDKLKKRIKELEVSTNER